MSRPVILLVEDDVNLARKIASAISSRIIACQLVHLRSGEEAVLWVGANACQVCLLDYDLPGIDGLETLARIHQRAPNLPVIMLSGAASEQVAIAAFRARVADFIPKRPGFEQAVAQLVEQQIGSSQPTPASAPLASSGIPPELLVPNYQNRLRVIGRHLDLYGYRRVTIVEVGGGFLVRGALGSNRAPEALEFANDDFPQLLQTAYAARGEGERQRSSSALLPSGYEDFLRALGHRFDTVFAEAVTITELDSFVAVGGVAKVDATGQTGFGPLQWLLRQEDIAFLLDEAFRRRAPVAEKRASFFRRS